MKRIIFYFFLLATLDVFPSFPIAESVNDPNDDAYKIFGYLLGSCMLIFGVIIAYAYNNKIMLKSAWRGFLAVIGLFIIFVTTLFVLYYTNPSSSSFIF